MLTALTANLSEHTHSPFPQMILTISTHPYWAPDNPRIPVVDELVCEALDDGMTILVPKGLAPGPIHATRCSTHACLNPFPPYGSSSSSSSSAKKLPPPAGGSRFNVTSSLLRRLYPTCSPRKISESVRRDGVKPKGSN